MTDIIELIDAYAETRHRCGGIYNAKTEAARKAVIEALSRVQALSAAPANNTIPLRELGVELRKTPVCFGGPEIWALFRDGSLFRYLNKFENGFVDSALLAASPPAEQPIGELVVTKTKDGQIISVTRQDDEGRILSVIATSDSAEQQAITPETEFPVSAQGAAITSESGAVYAELPEPSRLGILKYNASEMRGFADRTHALRMEQAAPKAAPRWCDGCTPENCAGCVYVPPKVSK